MDGITKTQLHARATNGLIGPRRKPAKPAARPSCRVSQSGGKPQRYCSAECRKAPKATGNPLPVEQDATPTVAPEPPKQDGEVVDFDWSDPRLTTIEEQPQTAIYINASGSLVIRQCRYPDDDAIVIITRGALDDFLEKVTDVGGIPSFGRSE
jgi:hypothetical protein